MSIGVVVILVVLAATALERGVEVVGRLMDKSATLSKYTSWLFFLAIGCGVLLAFNWRIDLIAALANAAAAALAKTGEVVLILPSPGGITLTGVLIGGGSTLVHQFVSLFLPSKT